MNYIVGLPVSTLPEKRLYLMSEIISSDKTSEKKRGNNRGIQSEDE